MYLFVQYLVSFYLEKNGVISYNEKTGGMYMQKKYDLIVVGGGFAGVAAAVEAAEKGLQVLLVEKYNCLGGAAANCLVMPFMPYSTTDPETGENRILTGNFFTRVIAELEKLKGTYPGIDRTFDEELLKLVLNRLCLAAGVELLFNTTVVDTQVQAGTLVSLRAWGKSRSLELRADYFVDATGDAELSVLAGCDYRVGRREDGLCQPMTLCFRVAGIDMPKFRENRSRITPLYQQFQKQGLIKNPREDVLLFKTMHEGILHFNTTRIVKMDPTDPVAVTKAELEAREQVFELHTFLKENIPGFEDSYVLSTAMQIGIRESRMVQGEYTLTQEDLKSLARFDDAIAVANYDIDIHNPEGSGTSHYYFGKGEWYQIPYRCLLPLGTTNLLVAGRCISSTHEAQASYRIMPFCSELGQAAGAAVSVAKESGKQLRNIDIQKLQNILRNEDFLI